MIRDPPDALLRMQTKHVLSANNHVFLWRLFGTWPKNASNRDFQGLRAFLANFPEDKNAEPANAHPMLRIFVKPSYGLIPSPSLSSYPPLASLPPPPPPPDPQAFAQFQS